MERKVYVKKHLSLIDVLGLTGLGMILTLTVFKSFDPRGLGIVGVLLLLAELFIQTKWRTSMICRNCGFDAVLYMRSPEQAGLKIKAFLDKRAESPQHLLMPPIRVTAKKQTKGQNLSLKI